MTDFFYWRNTLTLNINRLTQDNLLFL